MLEEICKLAKKIGATDIHLYAGHPLFCRVNGEISYNDAVVISENDIKKIILNTSSAKAREVLGHTKHVTYAADIDGIGRLRFAVFFDRGHFAIAIRFIKDRLLTLEEIGINEAIKKVFVQRTGLILVGSPAGEGKTTTIAAIMDYINGNFEKSIVTIENPVEIVFKDRLSSIIQRSIPIDTRNFFTGISEAGRIRPDIIVSDSLGYPDVFDEALALCESGTTVIGGTGGGDCQQIIERTINSRKANERDLIRNKIAATLTMIISQRLVSTPGGRKAIWDVAINTPQLKNYIKTNNMSMFRSQQAQGSRLGMMCFDTQLTELVRQNIITKENARELAIDKKRFA